MIALSFNASNTYGFLKCRYGSDSNLKSVASGFFGKRVLQTVSTPELLSNGKWVLKVFRSIRWFKGQLVLLLNKVEHNRVQFEETKEFDLFAGDSKGDERDRQVFEHFWFEGTLIYVLLFLLVHF